MSHIVRRKQSPLTAPGDFDVCPPRLHKGREIVAATQLTLGVEPKLRIEWTVLSRFWEKGATLLLFRNTTGFCAEKWPEDLNSHGQLVLESGHDDCLEQFLPEGEFFYTFVLQQKKWHGIWEKLSALRFSETVQSAKIALSRIHDQVSLRQLARQEELEALEHPVKISEIKVRSAKAKRELAQVKKSSKGSKPHVNPALSRAESSVRDVTEALLARLELTVSVQSDPRFKKLSKADQDTVLEQINQHLDPSEILARMDMQG